MSITVQKSVYQPGVILQGITQVRSGHCMSAKFSFADESKANSETVYEGDDFGAYNRIVGAAKSEFCGILGISDKDVMVSESRVDGQRFWCLITRNPTALPKSKYQYDTSAALKHTIGRGAIDI